MKIKAKDLGLAEKETKVYLALAQLGQAAAQEIAQEAEIKRSTAYLCLEHLKELGLISQTIRNNRRYFVAENPYQLLSLAEKEREKAQKREQKIMDLIPVIKSLSKQAKIVPKLNYHEGINGIWIVLHETLRKNNNQYFIGSFETLLKVLGREEFTKNYTDKRRKLGNKIYNICDQFKQPHRGFFSDPNFREIKYLPKNIKTTSSIWFYDNRLILFNFTKPYSATVVESIEIVSLLKFMFGFVWQALK